MLLGLFCFAYLEGFALFGLRGDFGGDWLWFFVSADFEFCGDYGLGFALPKTVSSLWYGLLLLVSLRFLQAILNISVSIVASPYTPGVNARLLGATCSLNVASS